MADDAELLRLYAEERSNPAFAEVVRRHIDLVYSVALPKVGGDAHAARDVVQLVFTALAAQARAVAGHRELAGWLYLNAHHFAAKHVRKERRRQTREWEAHAMQEISRRTEIDWDRVRPVLDEIVQQLGGADREAVLLRFFEQRSYAEIGAALRATEDAARMRVDRALEKLRSRLAARGVSSTAAALAAALGQQLTAAPAGLAATVAGKAVLAAAPIAAGAGLSFTAWATAGALGVAGLATAFVWSPRWPRR
jgi:RNA polymerase sigma factor (sigma-70 family)